MKKNKLKKLNLDLETIATLSNAELDRINGGMGGEEGGEGGGGGELAMLPGTGQPTHRLPSCRQSW